MNFNQPQNQTAQSFPNQIQNQHSQNSIQLQATFKVFTPDANYMPYTQQSSITCHK